MIFEKIKTHRIEKCYAVNQITVAGQRRLVAATEVVSECRLFDLSGNYLETIWREPGGTMSIAEIPGADGVFLASQKFYGPDDSKDSGIVLVIREAPGNWTVKRIAALPHLHRFDILVRNGVRYLIACTIKNNSEYEGDWRTPGKIYAAVFPRDPLELLDAGALEFKVVLDGLFKNHGYYRIAGESHDTVLISAENGICQMSPPGDRQSDWEVKWLRREPTSDAALIDLDGDGIPELVTISPFHGNEIAVHRLQNGMYRQVFRYDGPFAHAIWCGQAGGTPLAVLGHRLGQRDLLAIVYRHGYCVEIIDKNVGPANVIGYQYQDETWIAAANREIDQLAFYRLSKQD